MAKDVEVCVGWRRKREHYKLLNSEDLVLFFSSNMRRMSAQSFAGTVILADCSLANRGTSCAQAICASMRQETKRELHTPPCEFVSPSRSAKLVRYDPGRRHFMRRVFLLAGHYDPRDGERWSVCAGEPMGWATRKTRWRS